MVTLFRMLCFMIAVVPALGAAVEFELFAEFNQGDHFKYPGEVGFSNALSTEQITERSRYYKVYFDSGAPSVVFRLKGSELWSKYLLDGEGRVISQDDGTYFCTIKYRDNLVSKLCINTSDFSSSYRTDKHYENRKLIKTEDFDVLGTLKRYSVPNYITNMVDIYTPDGRQIKSNRFIRYR